MTPSQGYQLATNFVIQTSGWVAPPQDLPLTYSFYYISDSNTLPIAMLIGDKTSRSSIFGGQNITILTQVGYREFSLKFLNILGV